MLSSALWFLLAAAPASRVALMPLQAGEGVAEKTAAAVTESVAGEMRRNPGLQVITRQEISAVLSLERQKELLACQNDSCVAELGGALDVDVLVIGNLAKLGASWVIHLQQVDARKAITTHHSDRRQKGGSIDDVLDAIPAMVQELFPSGGARLPAVVAPVPAVVSAAPSRFVAPVSTAEVPVDLGAEKAKLELVTDGNGHYVAFVPFAALDGPVLAGTAQTLYQQRVFGGGSQGNTQFSVSFWEPRAPGFAGAHFGFRDGNYALWCGDKDIAFKPVPEKERRRILATTKLLGPRWRRHIYALARDDEGDYFYVDQAREPEVNSDLRLYFGPQGKMAPQPTHVLVHDTAGDVLGFPQGKLKLSIDKEEAEWIQGADRHQLTFLSTDANSQKVYTTLGPYRGEQLGSACDFVFSP